MTTPPNLNSSNVTASHFLILMHQMSQDQRESKAKLSKRQNKPKGNFQEELLDLQREQMVLQ